MKHSFSISEALGFGWNTFKKNWKFWVIAMIFAMSLSGASGGFGGSSDNEDDSSKSSNLGSNQKMVPIEQQIINENQNLIPSEQQKMPYVEQTVDNTQTVEKADKSENFLLLAIFMVLASPYLIAIIIFAIFSVIVLNCMTMGFNKLCLDAVRGNELKYETLLSIVNLKKSAKYLGAMFFYFLIIVVGFILFIIPGIYWAIKYNLFYFAIVDKNLGIFDSFKYSAKLTKGVKLKFFAFGLLEIILLIVGMLALFVGAFVVAIVIYLASAYIYETLRKQLDSESTSQSVPNGEQVNPVIAG